MDSSLVSADAGVIGIDCAFCLGRRVEAKSSDRFFVVFHLVMHVGYPTWHSLDALPIRSIRRASVSLLYSRSGAIHVRVVLP